MLTTSLVWHRGPKWVGKWIRHSRVSNAIPFWKSHFRTAGNSLENLGAVEDVNDIEDERLVLFRSRKNRNSDLYFTRALLFACNALVESGVITADDRLQMQSSPRVRRQLKKMDCVVNVHYSWDCLRQLLQAREKLGPSRVCVESVIIPTGTPDEMVLLARRLSARVLAVSRELFEPELSQDMEAESGHELHFRETRNNEHRDRTIWRRFEGGAAQSTVRYAVAFPVTKPLMAMRPPFLVLDGLSSAGNIGQILRTAYHFGVVSIVASTSSWNALNGRACRVSMGWLYYMDFHRADHLPTALLELKGLGIRIVAAENQFSQPVAPNEPLGDPNWALIVGHEGLGISSEAVALSDVCVSVPQKQGLCLNVAHAASICLYELSKQS